MEDKIKFPANVILIDVAFLNEVVYGAKNFLEGKLGRKLPDVDLPAWLSYLALDAGLREQENEVEVLLVHTPAADVLKCCEPSDVNRLNHQACRTPLGEFTFSSVTSSGLVSTEELFLDLMNLALDSADVKCLMLLPFHQVYGNGVEEKLAGRPFARCNSGYLVNLAQVQAVQQNTVQVGPHELQISRPKRRAFLAALADYIGGEGA